VVVHGGRELDGKIPISGYKHALTLLVAAAIALGRRVTLRNVPDMTESRVLKRIVERMGATGSLIDGVWELDTGPMRSVPVPARLSGLIHGSLYLVPALLARFGEVSFFEAGGDRFGPGSGSRPVEQVNEVLRRFGATVDTAGGLYATVGRLRGCSIDFLDFSTDPERRRLRGPRVSSATKTALILAAAAEGVTRLRHPIDRDATRELCDFLGACGATLTQVGDTLCVRPGSSTDPVVHHLISDSTGIVTYCACIAFVGGSLRLTGITR
jgi:UDP-N-acetylglucosamine 1-carboxyvinyltransferase